MLTPGLFLLLVLLVLLALAASPAGRAWIGAARRRKPRARTGTTVIRADGEEVTIPFNGPYKPDWKQRLITMIRDRENQTAAAALLIAVLALMMIPRLLPDTNTDEFTVLVAPFREPDGLVTQTGRSVAAELVAAVPRAAGQRVTIRLIETPPADAPGALAILANQQADALIWGTVVPGGMANQESVIPLLAYQPNGAFAPNTWDGYTGRFALPGIYSIANQPINGMAVLPDLLVALADYSAGRFDPAFVTFGRMADDYPALMPQLPRSLRGTILWARGDYSQAAGEYRRALGDAQGPEAAALLNNLGAILHDAGDPAANQVFKQASAQLNGQDLGQLRYNLGIMALRMGAPADAIASLEQARNLLPATTPLLLSLSRAYQANQEFDKARATLEAAEGTITAAAIATTPELANATRLRLHADVRAARALLNFDQLVGGQGPLAWKIQVAPLLPDQPLQRARDDLGQAIDDLQNLSRSWSRKSTSEDAAGNQVAGRIAGTQARRIEDALRDQKRWLAIIDTELGRIQVARPAQGVSGIWASLNGSTASLGQGRKTLEQLLAAQPRDADLMLLLGRNVLIGGDQAGAAKQFDAAAQLVPNRPEPPYYQALAALPANRGRGRELLARAITLEPAYFPARQRLAEIAEEDQDWPAAIEQRRWLAEHYPGSESALALAQALRRSGPSGFPAAEQVLLPLANTNDARALTELSRIYRAAGDPQASREMLERAQRIAPRDATLAYELGQTLEEQNDLAGAEIQYRASIDIEPGHIQAHLALARLYAATPERAAEQYQAALDAGADDPATLKQIGLVLIKANAADAAITAYDRVLKALPDDAEAHHGLAQAQLLKNRLDAAAQEEKRALDLRDGRYPEALIGLGDIALRRNDYQEAVRQYSLAANQNDRLPAAFVGLGRATAAQDNWSVALGHFRNAVDRDPESAEAHLWLGEALTRQNNASEAIQHYQQALALRSNYAEAYFGLAQAQMMAGQFADAGTNLRQALVLRPGYPEALLLQGKWFEQQGQDDRAITAYGDSISASGALAEPRYRRALLLIRRERLDEARNDLESAIRIQSNFPEAHYWLGRINFSQGQYQVASQRFQRAIEQRGGNYAEARFYEGLAQEQLGQHSDAINSLQTALAEDRNSAWASEAQAALARLGSP